MLQQDVKSAGRLSESFCHCRDGSAVSVVVCEVDGKQHNQWRAVRERCTGHSFACGGGGGPWGLVDDDK